MRLNHLCCLFIFVFINFASSSETNGKITVLQPVPPPLKVGWKTYFFQTYSKANWFRAFEFCRYQGMQLASIEREEEQLALTKYLNNTEIASMWTSGTNWAQNDTWVWFSNGYTAIYQNWDENEPNNEAYNGEDEHCIELRITASSKWNDRYCSFETYFICEKVKFVN